MALVAQRLHAAVHDEAIETRAGSVSATVSLGAVWLPQGAETSQEAMLRAEEALERAKGDRAATALPSSPNPTSANPPGGA